MKRIVLILVLALFAANIVSAGCLVPVASGSCLRPGEEIPEACILWGDGTTTILTDSDVEEVLVRLSPDKTRVGFSRYQGEVLRAFVINVDGTNEQEIATDIAAFGVIEPAETVSVRVLPWVDNKTIYLELYVPIDEYHNRLVGSFHYHVGTGQIEKIQDRSYAQGDAIFRFQSPFAEGTFIKDGNLFVGEASWGILELSESFDVATPIWLQDGSMMLLASLPNEGEAGLTTWQFKQDGYQQVGDITWQNIYAVWE